MTSFFTSRFCAALVCLTFSRVRRWPFALWMENAEGLPPKSARGKLRFRKTEPDLGAIALSLFCTFWMPGAVDADCRDDTVLLRGDWGQAKFTVEIADDPAERSRGLMFRENLPRNAGMLFVYERPQRARFWMKNTLIALDMLFVDRAGTVTHIHKDAIPGDLTGIDGGNKVFAVLEINGGLSERFGLTVGTQMQHPVFVGGPAIWPC